MKLDKQYEEQVYAGVLGKIIGVYLGRPFEGWTYERIMEELGPINYYVNDKLNMSVYMRSNDVWFGFCNDQYCFSMLQKLVSEMCNIKIGEYYHHAHNMHLYGGFFDRDSL